MLLLKDHNTSEKIKKEFAAEQDSNLKLRGNILKRTYNPNKIESRIEDARYMINRYYRKNGILSMDIGSSKFISKNVLLSELDKMIANDLRPVDTAPYEYYDNKTVEAVKKIIDGMHVLEV